MFELGSQLRKPSDSVITNIVEGYGRSTYRNDYIRFLITTMRVMMKQSTIWKKS
nr:four helix bundle protein [uncultured Chryseobacterium sp.]